MQQYQKAVFNGFGRCYGDIAWAKKKAAEYWRDSGCTGSPPEFFDALVSALSHETANDGQFTKIVNACEPEATLTYSRTGSYPEWWNKLTMEEGLRQMRKAKIRAAKLAAKLEADKAELEKVD